jgi:uncharacterized protein YdhG (YjbR/CyaY superfamily)
MSGPTDFDDYIARLPKPVQQRMKQMRQTIRKAAPQAEETISYRIPAFTLNGMLVWFAAFKNHIGLYPKVDAIVAFKKELAPYKTAKGTIQFPHDRPLPLSLVSRMVKFRVRQNLSRMKK